MSSVPLNLPPDYWQTLVLGKQDLEFINNYLFENESPLTDKELLPVLVAEHVRTERAALVKQQQGAGKVFFPKEKYKSGDILVFPALDWKKGKVVGIRPGINPTLGEFDVVEAEFDDGVKRQFAARLENHKLNSPVVVAPDDQLLNTENIIRKFGSDLERKLTFALEADKSLVRIAGCWFPRALLVDVNVGHLNLAEAVLDEANGNPLPTSAILEHVGLPADVNLKLVEFSLNYALQEDGRFDEVGPAGEILWYLKRLEPEDVQKIPAPLCYTPIDYDRSALTSEMLAFEVELDDELSEIDVTAGDVAEVIVSLTYPHWRAGTLPVSARMRGLLPTAYESPCIRFTLVDGQTGEEMPAWVIRQKHYVSGLGEYYKKYGLVPGSLIVVRRGKKPGETIVQAKIRRPIRDWVRTVLVGSDSGIVFAMLKQNIVNDFNERMIIYVPDAEGIDQACTQMAKERQSFEQIVEKMIRELTKLNVQGHVHAQELYSALNIVRRCPPAPLLAVLASQPGIKHVGDLYFRMADSVEGGNE